MDELAIDYAFDKISFKLRKQEADRYCFSYLASIDLRDNTASPGYTTDMWDDFWSELNNNYGESN